MVFVIKSCKTINLQDFFSHETNDIFPVHCVDSVKSVFPDPLTTVRSDLNAHNLAPFPRSLAPSGGRYLLLVMIGTLQPLTWLSSVSDTSICRGSFGNPDVELQLSRQVQVGEVHRQRLAAAHFFTVHQDLVAARRHLRNRGQKGGMSFGWV